MLDPEVFLAETRQSPPCGPNLEHDLSFFELEEAARGKPEQQIGDSVKPGEEPRWPRVAELAGDLLLRTKDLRVAVLLTRALLHTDGIPGLAAGLGVVHGLLDRYWDHVHPLLEVDAENDPTERLNALAPLADPEGLVKAVRDMYLLTSRELGQLQTREVEIALGRLPRPQTGSLAGVRPLDQIHAQIAAAFAEDRTIPAALAEANQRLLAIQNLLAERSGGAGAIDLKPLAQPLGSLAEACDAALGRRAVAGDSLRPAPEAGAVRQASDIGFAVAGEIQTREQAMRVLDLVCAYLERCEPSNPAPLFIRRAQRLMRKNFVDIVRDLLPDSLSQIERLAGEIEEK